MSLAGTMERPEPGYFYGEIHNVPRLAGDPQARAMYTWERRVLGGLWNEDPVGAMPDHTFSREGVRAAAAAYVEGVWARHAIRYSPFFTGVPSLLVRAELRRDRARAHLQSHLIYTTIGFATRAVLLHEVAHLLEWRDNHGPLFCRTLIDLWAVELGVDAMHSRAIAAEMGVEVAA